MVERIVARSADITETASRYRTIHNQCGNTKLTCHFEGPPITETYVTKGFLCGTYAGSTNDSHFVYTKSGRGTLTCHVNGNG